ELCSGGCESAARAGPVGGPATLVAAAAPTSPIATAIVPMPHLTKRSAGRFIKEVQVLRVHGDRHFVAEPQLHVWRERGDEIRARSDDRLGRAAAREDVFLFGGLALDVPRVDPEIRHR